MNFPKICSVFILKLLEIDWDSLKYEGFWVIYIRVLLGEMDQLYSIISEKEVF